MTDYGWLDALYTSAGEGVHTKVLLDGAAVPSGCITGSTCNGYHWRELGNR